MSIRPFAANLECPLSELISQLRNSDMRSTACEIFLALTCTSSAKLLSTATSPEHHYNQSGTSDKPR
ncbi:unnamed protein product [Linum trigynum]|uniref:Uncharacterized protein n=1 Tax=Linum trigynum TaxID=586398 RepID=A0AAV2DIG9_9ROSI